MLRGVGGSGTGRAGGLEEVLQVKERIWRLRDGFLLANSLR
jgi:hypothetical protein